MAKAASTRGQNPNTQYFSWRILCDHGGHHSCCQDNTQTLEHTQIPSNKRMGEHDDKDSFLRAYAQLDKGWEQEKSTDTGPSLDISLID